jgi:DNA-binding transcriptional LysR family regulator
MVNFNRLVSFVAIIHAGSFTRAAQTLGITKAMVSADLKRLEAELGREDDPPSRLDRGRCALS